MASGVTELHQEQEIVIGTNCSFSQLIAIYRKSRNVKKSTMDGYVTGLYAWFYFLKAVIFSKYVGEIPFLKATWEDIRIYVDYLNKNEAPETVRKYFMSVKHFYFFLFNRKLVHENIVTTYLANLDAWDELNIKFNKKKAKLTQSKRDKITMVEFDLIYQKTLLLPRKGWLPMAMDICLGSGIRRKSVSLLTLDDIQYNEIEKMWEIVLTSSDDPTIDNTKTCSQRIPITDALYDRIVKYVEKRNKILATKGKLYPEYANHIILGEKGLPICKEYITQAFMEVVRDILPARDIQIRLLCFHSIRKLYATTMLNEKGFSILQVSMLLGHGNGKGDIETTQAYLRVTWDELTHSYKEKGHSTNLDILQDVGKHYKQLSVSDIAKKAARIKEQILALLPNSIKNPDNLDIQNKLGNLVDEYGKATNQLMSPKEQEYLDIIAEKERELEALRKQVDFGKKLQAEKADYEQYLEHAHRQVKKSLKQKMKERAFQLRDENSWGGILISEQLFNEFGKKVSDTTIYNWLNARNQ